MGVLKDDIAAFETMPAGEPPDLPAKRIHALIDTGDGGECIDYEPSQSLRLPTVEEGRMVSGIGGRHRASVYLARVYVPRLERLSTRAANTIDQTAVRTYVVALSCPDGCRPGPQHRNPASTRGLLPAPAWRSGATSSSAFPLNGGCRGCLANDIQQPVHAARRP